MRKKQKRNLGSSPRRLQRVRGVQPRDLRGELRDAVALREGLPRSRPRAGGPRSRWWGVGERGGSPG